MTGGPGLSLEPVSFEAMAMGAAAFPVRQGGGMLRSNDTWWGPLPTSVKRRFLKNPGKPLGTLDKHLFRTSLGRGPPLA